MMYKKADFKAVLEIQILKFCVNGFTSEFSWISSLLLVLPAGVFLNNLKALGSSY